MPTPSMSLNFKYSLHCCVHTTAECIVTMDCRMEENASVEMSLVGMAGLQIVSATCHVGETPAKLAEDCSEIVYIRIGGLV